MADKTVYVRSSGGDYTSLAAAITGEVTANADLTASGMNGCLYIVPDDNFADTARPDVTGFTTDSTHYIVIRPSASHRAGTSYSSSKYRLTTGITLRQAYTRVDGLQIKGTWEGWGYTYISGAYVRFENCFIDIISEAATSYAIYEDAIGGAGVVRNCICRNTSSTNGVGIKTNRSYLYNCVAMGCSGIGIALGYYLVRNCYSGGNTGADYTNADSAYMYNCYSEDGSCSTSTVVYSTSTFTNITAGSENMMLVSGSGLIDAGQDLRSISDYPFDYDILGTTRGASWDVGPCEYVSSAVFSYTGNGTLTAGSGNDFSYSRIYGYEASGELLLSGTAITNIITGFYYIGLGNLEFNDNNDYSEYNIYSYPAGAGLTFGDNISYNNYIEFSYLGNGIADMNNISSSNQFHIRDYSGYGNAVLSSNNIFDTSYIFSFDSQGNILLSGYVITSNSSDRAYIGICSIQLESNDEYNYSKLYEYIANNLLILDSYNSYDEYAIFNYDILANIIMGSDNIYYIASEKGIMEINISSFGPSVTFISYEPSVNITSEYPSIEMNN